MSPVREVWVYYRIWHTQKDLTIFFNLGFREQVHLLSLHYLLLSLFAHENSMPCHNLRNIVVKTQQFGSQMVLQELGLEMGKHLNVALLECSSRILDKP